MGKSKNYNKEKINQNLKKIQKSKRNCHLRFRSHLVELLFYYKIKGSLKRFVYVMYSTTRFKRKVSVLSVLKCYCVKVLSPYNNKWVNESSFMDNIFGLTILTFCRRQCLSFLKFEQGRESSAYLIQYHCRSYKLVIMNPENYDEIYVHPNDLGRSGAW